MERISASTVVPGVRLLPRTLPSISRCHRSPKRRRVRASSTTASICSQVRRVSLSGPVTSRSSRIWFGGRPSEVAVYPRSFARRSTHPSASADAGALA